MPRKRRIAKGRTDQRAELKVWRTTFERWVTLDGDLDRMGFPDEPGHPTRAETEAAWRRLGQAFMATFGRDWMHGNDRRLLWALREFGEP